MEDSARNFTLLDHDLFKFLTKQVKITTGTQSRNAFYCIIDKTMKCETHFFNKSFRELGRLFSHSKKEHKQLFDNFLVDWLLKNSEKDLNQLSSIPNISSYIRLFIFPQYETQKKKEEKKIIFIFYQKIMMNTVWI